MKFKNVGSNMTEVEMNGCILLYSYNTPVAGRNTDGWHAGNCMFKTDQWYSSTTTRHINKWFKEHWSVNAKTEVEVIPQESIDELART